MTSGREQEKLHSSKVSRQNTESKHCLAVSERRAERENVFAPKIEKRYSSEARERSTRQVHYCATSNSSFRA